jgi:hypothetical protein
LPSGFATRLLLGVMTTLVVKRIVPKRHLSSTTSRQPHASRRGA